MEVILRIDSIVDRSSSGTLPKPEDLDTLFSLLAKIALVDTYHYIIEEGREEYLQFSSFTQLTELSQEAQSEKTYLILSDKDNPESDTAHISLSPAKISVVCSSRYESDRDLPPLLITQSISAITECYSELRQKYRFGPLMGLEYYDIPYQKIHPPRDMYPWGESKAVDFISEEYYASYLQVGNTKIQALIEAPLPEGVCRFRQGDLIILQWINDSDTIEKISEQLARRDKWYAESLSLPIQSDYNELGDRQELTHGWEKHPILTFYEPVGQIGYRMTLPYEDNSLNEDTVEEIASWIKNESLPDSTPIRKLNLIVPDRHSALSILDEAKSIGVKKVIYPDDNGRFWDPDPL